MKTIFDPNIKLQLIKRIEKINADSKAQWGKMNVYQMIKHLNIWNQWVLGIDNNIPYKQDFLGKIIGKMVLKANTKNDKPMGKGAPAGSNFTIKEKSGDFEKQKQNLFDLTEHYGRYCNPDFIHGFFGKMTKEQIGIFAYKHYDHHLRQFGV